MGLRVASGVTARVTPSRSARGDRLHSIERIRRERAAGRSLYAIANGLNADRVPTAEGGRRWYPAAVRYTLKRTRLTRAPSQFAGSATAPAETLSSRQGSSIRLTTLYELPPSWTAQSETERGWATRSAPLLSVRKSKPSRASRGVTLTPQSAERVLKGGWLRPLRRPVTDLNLLAVRHHQ